MYPLQLDWLALMAFAVGLPFVTAVLAYFFRVKNPYKIVLPAVALTQLCLLSFAYYPYAVDGDVWNHAGISEFVTMTGHISKALTTLTFPGFYISESEISQVSGLPPPLSFEVPFGIIAILIPLVLFEVMRAFSRSTTVAYLAAGIALTTNLGLVPGMYGPLASMFCLFLITVVLLLVFYGSEMSPAKSTCLILLICAITPTDPLYSALVGLFVVALYLLGNATRSGLKMDGRVVWMSVLVPVAFDAFNANSIFQQGLHGITISPTIIPAFLTGTVPASSGSLLPSFILMLDTLGAEFSKFVYFFFGGLSVLFAIATLLFGRRLRPQNKGRTVGLLTVLVASIISSSYFIATTNLFEGGQAGRFQELSYPFIVLAGIEFFQFLPSSFLARLARIGDRRTLAVLLLVGLLLAGLSAVYFVPRNASYIHRTIDQQQFEAASFVNDHAHGQLNFSYDGYFLSAYSYVSSYPSPSLGPGFVVSDLSCCAFSPSNPIDQIYSNGWVAVSELKGNGTSS